MPAGRRPALALTFRLVVCNPDARDEGELGEYDDIETAGAGCPGNLIVA